MAGGSSLNSEIRCERCRRASEALSPGNSGNCITPFDGPLEVASSRRMGEASGDPSAELP